MRAQAIALFLALLLITASFLYGQFQAMPDGTNTQSKPIYVSDADIDFLYDLTKNTGTERIIDQEIFENVYGLIDRANEFLVIDMFLFNHRSNPDNPIPLGLNFKNKLLQKRQQQPDVPIYFITDYFNTFYGSSANALIDELAEAGVNIIFTDTRKLRDSNPLLSAFYRIFVQPFGLPSAPGGVIPNFLGEGKIALRSLLTLTNFKANHRKLIVNESESMVISANPHTGSSLHSNVGVRVQSSLLVSELLRSEQSIARFSDADIPLRPVATASEGDIELVYLTEQAIESAIIEEIQLAGSHDEISIGMFYFSHRKILEALLASKSRGVKITLILDANKDAFGYEKNGIPNRQVALESHQNGIDVRWYKTNGEQFHSKIFLKQAAHHDTVILGSGNYTRRNLSNYNLEANLRITAPIGSNFSTEVRSYFAEVLAHSLPFAEFEDTSKLRYAIYRFQEWSGLSTF
ncbi:phospholipase D-like domain-containing protein [Reinekea marinisedimentorum]|uniref:phospholipase D n=1 Tax=Reinekea marinisedimentorum TaxID=230495 RepID=A0A4R3I548_9GAMM|nr:phospholipase D-like domain-containing protein [Reinekea marinisedimentorum]TCS41082.1 phosphatidylserine/phosphatidylglycerophosphate/cardiolipin synthase-like enzyme [Reinekea marinisedimentorum]